MTFRTVTAVAALVAAIMLTGCSQSAAPQQAEPAAHGQGHAHGSSVSKLGLQPAVLDGYTETNDVALIKDGKLVEVDLLNTIGTLHGIFSIPREGTVLITIEGKNVAWSETPTDYPVRLTIPGPVRREGARVRMSAEQLEQLFAFYYPDGTMAVKDGKLHFTTGR